MNPMLVLFLAIASEVIGSTSLKISGGFSRPLPSIVVVIGYGAAFYLLSIALKTIPLGTAYAIWSGVGTVGTVIVGVLLWRESFDLPRFAGVALIVVGVVVLNAFSETAAA
jgi:multidrug transporter EmrE-like cation transporter